MVQSIMSRKQSVDALDDFLSKVKRLLDRPGYRRQFMSELGYPIAPSTLRAVRAVERMGTPEPFVGDVAAHLAVDASTATRAVEQAVKDDYLKKVPCKEDQRRVALRLTDKGVALLARADRVRHGLLNRVTRDWTSKDLQLLASLLERLSSGLKDLEE